VPPGVLRCSTIDEVAEGVVVARYPRPFESVAVPDELFLRGLLTLDVDDQGAVIDFSRSHQALLLARRIVTIPLGSLSLGLPFDAQTLDRWASVGDEHSPSGEYGEAHAVDELQASARLVRSLTAHWVAHCDGEPVVEAWRWAFKGPLLREERCWAAFSETLNLLLRPFSPKVVVDVNARYRVGADDPELAAVLALQVHNAVVESLPVRSCPNCGQRFIRQEGRAVHGQYRTSSVTYCSKSCAKAKAQRDYRLRQRKGSP
jgi:hypothetical protein